MTAPSAGTRLWRALVLRRQRPTWMRAVLVAFGVGLLTAIAFTTIYGLFAFKEIPFSAICGDGMCMGLVHFGSVWGVLAAFGVGFVAALLRRRWVAP